MNGVEALQLLMQRDEDCSAPCHFLVKNLQNPLPLLSILRREGLIQEQYRCTSAKCAQEFSPLGFTAGKLVWMTVDQGLQVEIDRHCFEYF